MLQLKDISKSYTVANFTQQALDKVSISFRENEFVSILGPSGSGKTTLLNIVGGLDRYESGSLSVDGVDTAQYSDRDWDAYRNNRVGFVFQSYNLIPHQSVLANVELALTLSGVSREERKKRAEEALTKVGLGEHIDKKPNQLSGGQMQRVAIARALINDPEILLADEPTGALDTATSAQIMDLLSEIANDRLVIMVTHNPELAEKYSTRIVKLRDGVVSEDSMPFNPGIADRVARAVRKTSMSFMTAVSLSFNNLMTKKGRTIMTAFAGSIGIIGIAAILALANGVNNYIKTIEEDTLSVYPLTIQSQGMDMGALLSITDDVSQQFEKVPGDSDEAPKTKNRQVPEVELLSKMLTSVGSNDLASLKTYLDSKESKVAGYTQLIQYGYNLAPQIFVIPSDNKPHQVNPDKSFASLMGGGSGGMANMMPAQMSGMFAELIDDESIIDEQYEVVAGSWPKSYKDIVLVLTPAGGISDYGFYAMGLRDPAELEGMMKQMLNNEEVVLPEHDRTSFSYDEILATKYKLVQASDYYSYDEAYGLWTDKSGDEAFVRQLALDGEDLRISGIVQAREGVTATALRPGLYYTSELVDYLSQQAAGTQLVKDQLKDPGMNVLTGKSFASEEETSTSPAMDMSKLFSIDQNAISKAFKFDQSKLKLDTSALDFSAMDMPSMNIDPATLPALDMSALMGDMNLVGDVNLDSVISDVDLEAAGMDRDTVSKIAQAYGGAFMKYLLTQPDAGADLVSAFEAFSQTEEAAAILTEYQEDLSAAQAGLMEQIATSIQKQIEQQVQANSAKMQAQLQAAMGAYMQEVMTGLSQQIQAQMGAAIQKQMGKVMQSSMSSLTKNMSSAMSINEDAFKEAFKFNMDEEELSALMMSLLGKEQSSYDGNLAKFGYADKDRPYNISIYPKDFASKAEIITILDTYNENMEKNGDEDKVIQYTDLVGTLMSSVTDIIDVISYVLAAFVAISLVVSSIMIGVITYVSVLERKKEIGILRSIGASKRDIRRVFNAETLIVGFVAGALGIGTTLLISIPANIIVEQQFGIKQVMLLPMQAAGILVVISMGLTYLSGLIPASAASRKDPVEALRAE